MKKIYILLCLVVVSVTILKSQNMVATEDGLSDFLKGTVYVPITGNVAFDEALQKGFAKYWKITPYKIIGFQEYKKLAKINDKQGSKDIRTAFLFEWGSESFYILGICRASTFCRGTEYLVESYHIDASDFFAKTKNLDYVRYRIEYIVKALNDMITYTRDNKIGNDPKHSLNYQSNTDVPRRKKYYDIHVQISKLINTNSKIIKDKTLVLNKDMKFLNKKMYDPKEFGKLYPYPYKFVSEAEFNEILKNEQKEYVCYIPAYYADNHYWLAYEFVYEPATRSTIYMGITPKFTKSIEKEEIDQLKKAIAK